MRRPSLVGGHLSLTLSRNAADSRNAPGGSCDPVSNRRPIPAPRQWRPPPTAQALPNRLRRLQARAGERGEEKGVPRGTLFLRLFLANAAILLLAVVLLALTPATVSQPVVVTEVLVLAVGLGAVLLLNAVVIRRALAPLDELTEVAHRIDLLRPGRRVAVWGDYREVVELAEAFNSMLERLESERLESTRRTLAAQEDERLRVARELHDEVGQILTALLLQHEALDSDNSTGASTRTEMRESVRAALDEVRRIAGDLRPIPLDDFGLDGALRHLGDRAAQDGHLELTLDIAPAPSLSRDAETAIYRITQEALTNVLRHANATRVELELAGAEDGRRVRLRVADNGQGLGRVAEGHGIRGMRERAMLVGASLSVGDRRGGGTEVLLDVDLAAAEQPSQR